MTDIQELCKKALCFVDYKTNYRKLKQKESSLWKTKPTKKYSQECSNTLNFHEYE